MVVILVTVVLAVLAGTLYNNQRFEDANRRFDDVHRRIDDLRSDINARFAALEGRMDCMEEELWFIPASLRQALRTRSPRIGERGLSLIKRLCAGHST